MPYSPYDGDNHVVTHAYIRELDKWIMIDPTFDSYVTDENNTILNVFEIRDSLANIKDLYFNEEMNHNGNEYSGDHYKEYLAKDLFYFQTPEMSCFNAEDNSRRIAICPKYYDVKNAIIYNIEYRIINQWGANDRMQAWLKSAKENNILYVSPDDVLLTPYTC